jgi:hypothetical protein
MSFTASKSAISSETLVEYLEGFDGSNRDLESVPGIGPAACERMFEAGVKSPQALLGKLLALCEEENECHDAYQSFYTWVHEVAPRANAHTIVFAMASLADHVGLLPWED